MAEILFGKVYNGNEGPLFQRVTIPDGFPIYNQPHEIDLIVEGDHHVIKVDGEVVLDFYDNTFTSGMAGRSIKEQIEPICGRTPGRKVD